MARILAFGRMGRQRHDGASIPDHHAERARATARQAERRPAAAGGGLKVYVTAPPEDGRANDAVVETIAEWLGVKRRQVEIMSGATNRNKVVRVTNVSQAQLDAALPRDTP